MLGGRGWSSGRHYDTGQAIRRELKREEESMMNLRAHMQTQTDTENGTDTDTDTDTPVCPSFCPTAR